MKILCFNTFLFVMVLKVSSQSLLNGPMHGYLAFREAAIWVQTDKEATVQLRYWSMDKPLEKHLSEKVMTQYSSAFTATLITKLLELGTTYQYEILINDKPVKQKDNQSFTTNTLWKWRTKAPDFSFLAGSCNYVNDPAFDRPGKPYGGDHVIFENMAKEDANFMLWLGDNVYLREPDWDSRSGIHYRYTHVRSLPELQPLLRKMHHYAIWDDHDYGPNDEIRSYYLRNETLDAFKYFWANPNYGVANGEGITGFFQWSDCDFYLLDDRWFRTPSAVNGELLGQEQLNWLIESLRLSQSRYKFISIGTQVLNSAKSAENHANYVEERSRLLAELDKYNIKGVIFLTGDRHNSEISKYTTEDGDVFYDLTVSPLTSGSTANTKEINHNRVEGSYVGGQRNYANISVVGEGEDRRVEVIYKDKDGKELYKYQIKN
jgi:alkaline phosphatase D